MINNESIDDKPGADNIIDKLRMVENIEDERNVGLDSSDPELCQ